MKTNVAPLPCSHPRLAELAASRIMGPSRIMRLLKEPELITRNGKPTAVILPIKEYQALLERAEDAEDARWLKERRNKPMSFRTLDEFLAKHSTRA